MLDEGDDCSIDGSNDVSVVGFTDGIKEGP